MDEPGEPGTDVPVDFDAYVALRWTRLVRAAVLLGAGREEAEDVVQSCLVRCLVRWDRVRAADDVDAYVHKALVNTFVSSRRRRWHGERPTEHLPEVVHVDAADEVDHRDAVLRALERLGADQRAVVVLRYYSHLTERQTAEALGVAPGTVKSRLSRALRVLAADPSLLALRGAG
ncbi:SigE family RNA polymerase sigma factor [Nocardioides sp. CPCC 205120]|uniref:SigE family RNA polymerase sigma factor n=1 Tax=Nocardioides sp. CPCC 205120 TaxID=3406462 RepID=UPI003B5122D5